MYTMHESEDTVLQAFQAGVRAYVLKSDTERSLLAGIDAVSSHRTYFSGTICEALLADFMRNKAKAAPSALTHREREVVQLIAEGKLNKQVGHILGISIKTVETHRASAMQKLNMSSSAELIRYAVRNNMVEP
jgi:DNA-binding NarL/FixJ family response regulator